MDYDFSEFDRLIMSRCFELAKRGGRAVRSNPLVGCVITNKGKIIGEGYHQRYGEAHAEVNAIASVSTADKTQLDQAELYVSLEPCNHTGKTPPCTNAIMHAGFKKVTISALDPNPRMQGKSVELLRNAGIQVRTGLLEKDGQLLIERFRANSINHIPYVILKWAQSQNFFIGREGHQVWLSNKQSKLLTHQWRSEEEGILIGTNTALTDNPLLTNRLAPGPSPLRFVLDRDGRLPKSLKLFEGNDDVTIISTKAIPHVNTIVIDNDNWNIKSILKAIFANGIHSLIVEGGAQVLKSIIKEGLWHEARVIQTKHRLDNGIKSPSLSGKLDRTFYLNDDKVLIINNI